jgi:hypothetical protein
MPARVSSHQTSFRDDVTRHRFFHRALCCRAWQRKSGIECVGSKIISVRTRGRAWPTIPGAAEIARPLDSILRHAVLPNLRCFRIDVPNEPMGPGPARRIRIIHDQRETLDGIGKIFNAQRRAHIGIITRIFFWNFPAVGKRAASHFKGSRTRRALGLSEAGHRHREHNQQEQSNHRFHGALLPLNRACSTSSRSYASRARFGRAASQVSNDPPTRFLATESLVETSAENHFTLSRQYFAKPGRSKA